MIGRWLPTRAPVALVVLAHSGRLLQALLVVATVHTHHSTGTPIGYPSLAAASAVSWFGLAGPGEAVLIAAGVRAANHKLDLVLVLVAAWLGAVAGETGGWLVGRRAGRKALTGRGPFPQLRVRMLALGDRVFSRRPVLGILIAPAWMAGVHRVPAARFLSVTIPCAAAWSTSIGIGAYLAGPTIDQAAREVGVLGLVVLIVLIVGAATEGRRRRRQRRRRARESGADGVPER